MWLSAVFGAAVIVGGGGAVTITYQKFRFQPASVPDGFVGSANYFASSFKLAIVFSLIVMLVGLLGLVAQRSEFSQHVGEIAWRTVVAIVPVYVGFAVLLALLQIVKNRLGS
jgi:hypothetical protein